MAADQTDWKAQYDELLRNHEDYKESRAQAEEELENELLTAEERSVEFELKYEEEKQAKEIIMVSHDRSWIARNEDEFILYADKK